MSSSYLRTPGGRLAAPQNAGEAPDARSWLAATIDARGRALEAASLDARAICAVRLARAMCWSGDDAAAHRLLVGERRQQQRRRARIEVLRLELGLAELALVNDDEDRATVHLENSRDPAPEDQPTRAILAAWVAARRGSHHPFAEPIAHLDSPWIAELADMVALELSWSHVEPDGGGLDLAAMGMEPRGSDVRTRALVELIRAARARDVSAIKTQLRTIEKAGLHRDLGRALLRLMAIDATILPAIGFGATAWIARAQGAIGESATWRDKVALRHAWRLHGRRDADRALPREVAIRLDARERMRAHVQSTLTVGLDRQSRALDELESVLDDKASADGSAHVRALGNVRDAIELLDTATTSALGELSRVEGELAQIVASTYAERERARTIATTLAGLEAVTEVEELVAGLTLGIEQLINASAVVIAERVPYVGLRALGARGIEATSEIWIEAAESALDTPISSGSSRRNKLRASSTDIVASANEGDRRGGSEAPEGPALVVAMRAAGTEGAIYVDKRASGGSFSATDRAALELFASYGGVAIARLRATSASASLGRRLAATIDAMRDGLIALDPDGVVTAINEPATRALRVEATRVLGRRLAEVAELQPLVTILAQPERPDGAVVRLPHTSLVVHARGIEGEGIVATLVEYERAQKIAQKLVGQRTRYTFSDLRGRDPALLEALDVARRAAAVDASVLIIGESGTGKELLAQAIHAGGPRGREPFVAVNCAALPRELLEAELFGYERGAFTGARAEGSVGKFELAGDGTFLLDEIVDLPLDMQAKLLRVLQERVVVRLGSNVERPVRARVLATAQRDLAIDVEKGRFRLDLLHRLRVLQIQLPPLRARAADVSLIARHYVRTVAERQGKAVRDFTPEVEQALITYGWPGNVRELANVIEGEVSLLSPEATILDRVPASIARARNSDPPASGRWGAREPAPASLSPETMSRISLYESTTQIPISGGTILPLAEVERRAYLDAYEKCARSVTRAARALGVSKVTFYGKLRQFGMHPSEVTGEIPALRASAMKIPVSEMTPPENAYDREGVAKLAVPDSGPESQRSPSSTAPPRSRR